MDLARLRAVGPAEGPSVQLARELPDRRGRAARDLRRPSRRDPEVDGQLRMSRSSAGDPTEGLPPEHVPGRPHVDEDDARVGRTVAAGVDRRGGAARRRIARGDPPGAVVVGLGTPSESSPPSAALESPPVDVGAEGVESCRRGAERPDAYQLAVFPDDGIVARALGRGTRVEERLGRLGEGPRVDAEEVAEARIERLGSTRVRYAPRSRLSVSLSESLQVSPYSQRVHLELTVRVGGPTSE